MTEHHSHEVTSARYRTGPLGGTLVLTALAIMGVLGLASQGPGSVSIGSAIFAVVVISLFVVLAAVGLNDLRGVRTERRPDGTAVLKLPGLVPTRTRWWRTVPAEDIETVSLVLVSSGRGGRSYQLGVTQHDGTAYTSGAVATNRPRRRTLSETRAGRMVEQIWHDLGLDRP